MSIIDFQKEHDKRHGPGPDHVIELDGERWYRYAVDFRHNDATFSTEIWAMSEEHAEDVLNDFRETAVLAFQILGTEDQ